MPPLEGRLRQRRAQGATAIAGRHPPAYPSAPNRTAHARTPQTAVANWLLKSEPSTYSIDDLRRDGRTSWEGVRNYQARNFMRDTMREGDRVLFHHSNATPPGVAGIGEIVRAGYPDETALDPDSPYFDPKATPDDPRWYRVDVGWVETFPHLVALERMRSTPGLEAMPLLNRSRLSVQPVTDAEFDTIVRLGRG
jgi:predicted RNA-binding protein with PUA-like domain